MVRNGYDPHDMSAWEGKTFFTENSEYSVRDGKFCGRKSLDGAKVSYVTCVSDDTWGEIRAALIRARLEEGVETYTPELKKKFDEIALRNPRAPQKGLSIVVGIDDLDAKRVERVGIATSRLVEISSI
jgi:hypothetical protein